jgi:hypothetical protein
VSESTTASEQQKGPGGISGKRVLLAIILVSIVSSTAVVRFVQPRAGSEPAEVHNRPFGPATRGDQNSAPLIYRRGDGD